MGLQGVLNQIVSMVDCIYLLTHSYSFNGELFNSSCICRFEGLIILQITMFTTTYVLLIIHEQYMHFSAGKSNFKLADFLSITRTSVLYYKCFTVSWLIIKSKCPKMIYGLRSFFFKQIHSSLFSNDFHFMRSTLKSFNHLCT